MEVKTLDKSRYSEWVVRNTLYWMSPLSPWTLEESDTHWRISFAQSGLVVDQELSRLLNDYLLRERLVLRTDRVRQDIASSVLNSIQECLTK